MKAFFLSFAFAYSLIEGHELSVFQDFFDSKQIALTDLTISRLPGFTNKNFLVEFNNEQCVFRLPGAQTAGYLNRQTEYQNTLMARQFGFYPADILYFDPKTGCQISSFVTSSSSLLWEDFYSPETLEEAVKLLKRLHTSDLVFSNLMDPFERIDQMISMLEKTENPLPNDYKNIEPIVHELKYLLSNDRVALAPCHNDPVPSNYVITNGNWALFDWEHSGMNDPAWDLAFLAAVMDYSDKQIDEILDFYQPENPLSTQVKLILYRPIVEYWIGLWAFAEIPDQSTVEGKEFFSHFSKARLKKCHRYLASTLFSEAKKALKLKEE